MPSLGADLESATVVRWLVAPGDHVAHGQVIAEVETDKGVVDIEVFEDGVVQEIVVAPGQKVAVGTLLARVGGEGADGGTTAGARAPATAAVQAAAPATAAAQASTGAAAVARAPAAATVEASARAKAVQAASPAKPHRRSSPAARVLAETLGLELEEVGGTGPGGAVTLEDVRRVAAQRAATSPPPATPAAPMPPSATPPVPAPPSVPVSAEQPARPAVRTTVESRAAMRASIAALMTRSKREIPHYYLGSDIDMGRSMQWLQETNASLGVADRLLPAVLLIKAVALATRQVPEMNGFFQGGRFVPSARVHAGVAVSLRDSGLVAPAILDADRKSLRELMTALRDVVSRARSGHLRASEMSEPTITITNLGDQGVQSVFGVIYPPQVALVGFGRIAERPPGIAGARPIVTATLSADHRVSDGHRGAVFLVAIDRLLQKPEEL